MIITRDIAQELAHGGWREEPLGYYSSGQQLKPLEGWSFLVRRTPLTSMGIRNGDIATISPASDPENPLTTRISGRGQISVWEPQKGCLTPPPESPLGNEIKSLARLRSGHESLVLGFDTEWGGDGKVLSMQFSAIEGNDLVEMVFLSQGGLYLSLDVALGRCLEHLGLPSVDERPFIRYKYCHSFQTNGKPIETITQFREEAIQNSRYIWVDGAFLPKLIQDQPDKRR